MRVLIAGGGIGGLATALMLERRGIPCEVHEQAPAFRELGVGITLMPMAVAELAELGLLPALLRDAIPSAHLHFRTRRGQAVWDEPRGLAAGHPVPQLFVHRGRLLGFLAEAALARLPECAVRLGSRLLDWRETEEGVEATVAGPDGARETRRAEALIGADGIHSAVRARLHPGEGPPRWSGLMMWRGAVDRDAFLGGASLMILGGVDAKLVLYPIGPGSAPDRRLTNWVVIRRQAPDGAPLPDRADWTRPARHADVAPHLDLFSCAELDHRALVAATPEVWAYAMFDRDPAPFWSQGRATLLGDAAHPMYPMGANGGTQAILDARTLADTLVRGNNVAEALARYEAERLPRTAALVRANRQGGPEAVIDAVERLAPEGFTDVDAVLDRAARAAILQDYARMAGSAPPAAPVVGG